MLYLVKLCGKKGVGLQGDSEQFTLFPRASVPHFSLGNGFEIP